MPEIRTWANSVGQQIENMTVDLVATTAAGISEAAGDVFFVGRPASNNAQEWILKKITPTELNKMVYNYLTSSAIANLFASVLGDIFQETKPVSYTIEQGGSITIDGLGLYLIRMSRNRVTSIVVNGYERVDLYNSKNNYDPNSSFLSFSKNESGTSFQINHISTTQDSDIQRNVLIKKLF